MPGRAFADLLDEALGQHNPAAQKTTAARLFSVQPPHPLLFFRIPDRVDTTLTVATHAAGARHPAAPLLPAAPSQRARLLTRDERRALDTLTALGAALSADFTASELRRQYRLLARRVHPDRHPDASVGERTRLSQAFAAATDSYRLLSATVTTH